MRRPASTSLPSAFAMARALAWAVGVALAAGGVPAGAEDLTGRAELTYGQDQGRNASSEYFRQIYLLNFRHLVAPPTSYQLKLRFRDDRGTLWSVGEKDDLRYRLLEPSAGLDHRLDDFGVSLTWRRNEERTLLADTGEYLERTIQRFSGSLYVRPFERGEVALFGDRLSFGAVSVNTLDQRGSLGFRYTGETLRLLSDLRVQRLDDHVAQATRLSVGPRIVATYARSLGPRNSLSAHYVLDYFLTQQDSLSGTPVTVPVEVDHAAGLFIRDDVPIDTDPMFAEPRLVDRVYDVSAGVSLGPGGFSFNNLGLDMGRFVTVDQLRVHVRDAAGSPVALGGPITWTAYSSQDGLRWAELAGATAAYSVELSAYSVTFPATSARYFKVVNFGVTTVECFVTELQPLAIETFQPYTTRRSQSLRQSASLSMLATPADKLVVNVTGLLNADLVTPERGAQRWLTDGTVSATAKLGPYGDFLYALGQTYAIAREPAETQNTWTSSASVRFQPVERYDSTFEVRASGQHFARIAPAPSGSTVDYGASLGNRFEPYDTLRFGVGMGAGRQEFDGGATTDYVTGSAHVHADLRRDLQLRLQSTVERLVNRFGEPSEAQRNLPLVQIVPYQIHTAEGRYHPNAQLGLEGRVGYVSTEGGEGVIEGFRVTWNPFPGGSVHFAFDYSQDFDPLTGRKFERLSATPRWEINRHASLLLSYNDVRANGSTPTRQETLYLTFTMSL